MNIKNHWLVKDNAEEKIKILKSGNARDPIDPDHLVIHYTATADAQSAINWFMDTKNNPDKIAAHIVLDYDGTITQLVPFNLRANHAGTSTWDGVESLNYHSIGIEIVNRGFADHPVNSGTNSKTIKASHKHKFWDNIQNWYAFPDAQLQALYQVAKAIFETYQLISAVGHDDISPARKLDPGPAFPWDEFKQQVFGTVNNSGKVFTVNTDGTNLRAASSTNAASIKKLPVGYEVGLIETNGEWSKVYLVNSKSEVLITQNGKMRSIKTIGWIFSKLLTLKAGQIPAL